MLVENWKLIEIESDSSFAFKETENTYKNTSQATILILSNIKKESCFLWVVLSFSLVVWLFCNHSTLTALCKHLIYTFLLLKALSMQTVISVWDAAGCLDACFLDVCVVNQITEWPLARSTIPTHLRQDVSKRQDPCVCTWAHFF